MTAINCVSLVRAGRILTKHMKRFHFICYCQDFANRQSNLITTFLLLQLQDNLLASHLTSRDLSAMDLDTACFIHHDAYVLNLNPFSGSNLSTARMSPNVPSNKERFKNIHFVSQSIRTSEVLFNYRVHSVKSKMTNFKAILIF
jgi:hypothetical protein